MDVPTPTPSTVNESSPALTPNSTKPPAPKRPTPLDAALAYHAMGLRIVLLHNIKVTGECSCKAGKACDGAGKHPRLAGWNKPDAGMLSTTDEIKDAFKRFPRANIGIITGGTQFSNLVCIDVDPRHGGNESLTALIAANSPFPATWQANTGSGGSHYLFRHPGPGWKVSNSQADDKKHHPKLGTGLDVKGDRGQFVVEPSVNAAGKYKWVNAPGGSVELAELPEWLRDMVAEKEGKKTRRSADSTTTTNSKRTVAWAKNALDAECQRVIDAPEHKGSDILASAASNIGEIVGGGGLSYNEAVDALLAAATHKSRRPIHEASKTIHGQLKFGMKSPRIPPDDQETAKPSQFDVSAKPNEKNKDKSIEEHDDDPHRLARAFLDQFGMHYETQRLWKWRMDWYNWGPTTKCYREVHKSEIKDQLCSFIKMDFNRIAEETKEKPRKVSGEVLNNAFTALSAMCLKRSAAIDDMPAWLGTGRKPSYIPLENGLLDISALQTAKDISDILHPHTPEWFSVDLIPTPFDPDADCPKWHAFLERNLENDPERIAILQEWFGYCLTYDTGFQKFLVLHGEGANGKSVICAALIALLGMANISTVPLELFGERFPLATTLGKLANITADVGEIDRAAEGQLKSFTSGDTMHFDRKNKDALITRPTARLVLATNNLPRFNDKSSGLWRRIILMPLNVTVGENERVPNMDKPEWWREQGEISGILNWALIGRERLYRQGQFTDSKLGQTALDEYKIEVNPVRQYFDEEVTISNDTWLSSNEFYDSYSHWCKRSGYHAMSKIGFFREVARMTKRCPRWNCVERIRDTSGTRRVWGYSNLSVPSKID